MSDTLVATLGGLWAMLLWGTSDWSIARNSKKIGALEANAILQIPGLLISVLIIVASRQHLPSMHTSLVIWASGLLFSIAYLSFVRALKLGSTGIVVPVSSVYPFFTLIFSAIFVSIVFSHRQILSMLVIIVGVIMLAFEKRNKNVSLAAQHKASIFALTAAIFWGIGNVITNTVIKDVSWPIMIGFIDIAMTTLALIYLLVNKRGRLMDSASAIKRRPVLWLTGAVYTFGSLGFYYSSVRVGNVIIPLVISSAGPLVTSGLAAIIDKEKLPILKRAGAVVAVAGIIFLNLK